MIIAWHQDRLLRLTSDLEKVINLGIPIHMVTAGFLNLSTPAGRATARTMAAWSQFETEQKALRQKSANRQAAENGHWQFSNRPYGYERVGGKIMQIENEVKIIRDGYRRVLRGDSYRSIAGRWNRLHARWDTAEFAPLKGGPWRGSRVQRLLENSHYAGIVTYDGEVIELTEGKSPQWEPAIDAETWARYQDLVGTRKRKRTWAATPKHLLSGMLTCGVCGGQMFSHAQYKVTRTGAAERGRHRLPVKGEDGRPLKHTTYVCFERHCTSIRAEYVEGLVEEIVIGKLSDERIVRALRPTDDTGPLQQEILDLQRRRDDITDLLSEGLISRVKARDSLTDLALRLERAQSRLSSIRAQSPLSDLLVAESIPARWRSLPVLTRRRIISDIGLDVTIASADMGKRTVDPDTGKLFTERAWSARRVRWEWRQD